MEKTPETEEKTNQQEQQTGSPSPGKGPGRWEAIKQKILQKAGPWIERAKRHPETAVLGQFLYNVGFWGEYTARRMVRFVWNCIRKAGERIVWLWGLGAGLAGNALKTGVQDLTAPFTRMANGAKNIRARVQEEKQAGTAHAAREGLRYFALGVHKYFPLLGRAAAYVLPVAALAVFGYTVHTVLEYNYVLAVEVNGSVVGYVQTEQVFDSAKEEVAQRINYAGTDREGWTVEPSYQIAVGEEVMDENQMAAAILESSSDEIQNATGVYVNGELVAVTTEGDVLQADLDSMIAPYEDPENPNLTVEFTKDIRLENSHLFYAIQAKDDQNVVLLDVGDRVTIQHELGDEDADILKGVSVIRH